MVAAGGPVAIEGGTAETKKERGTVTTTSTTTVLSAGDGVKAVFGWGAEKIIRGAWLP